MAAEGDAELLKAVIEEGANVDAKDKDGWTALAYAVAAANADNVQALLDAGARPFGDTLVTSPIVIAAAAGSANVLRPLLQKQIPPGHINEAYSVAAASGNEPFLDLLSELLGLNPKRLCGLEAKNPDAAQKSADVGEADDSVLLVALRDCRAGGLYEKTICLAR